MEADAKAEQRSLGEQIKQIQHEVFLLEIKLREKDQEVKLNDLKQKELRKQVPHNRLKPLTRDDKSRSYNPRQGYDARSVDNSSNVYLTSLPTDPQVSDIEHRLARQRRYSKQPAAYDRKLFIGQN